MLAVTGCVDEKKEITLNPDGTGKMVYEVTFNPFDLNLDNQESDPEEDMKKAIVEILEDSKGIEAWKDISFKLTAEKKAYFIGTAYFHDISKVEIKPGGVSSSGETIFSKDESGQLVFEIKHEVKKLAKEKKELTESQLTEEVLVVKQKYNKSRVMMLGMVEGLRNETVIHLPGRIVGISNFEKIDNTTARIKLDGMIMLEGMDAIMQDDEYLKEQIRAGRNPIQDGPGDELKANEIFYGQHAPVRVVIDSNAKKQFDYKAEVATAKANFKNMLKESGVSAKSATLIAQGADVALNPGDVIIAGVRLVRYSDSERGIRPFNHDKGYTLSMVLELPDENYFIGKGIVELAVTDTGQDILPESDHAQKINWVRMSNDNKAAKFDIKLLLPDDKAKGLAELSGTLDAIKSTDTKKIVLEDVDFTKNEKYTIDGFTILPIKAGSKYISITPKLLVKEYIATKFYDESGTEFKVKGSGSSSSNGKYTRMGFRAEEEFPDKGKIVFEVRDNMSEHKIPFKISNVSLTGEPLD
jgi:hypothetical protein